MANFVEMFEVMYAERGSTNDPKFINMSRVEYAQWGLQNMHKLGFTGVEDQKTARAYLMAYIKEFTDKKSS